MYTAKSYNKVFRVFRNQHRVFLLAVSVMMLLMPLTSGQAAEQESGEEITGTVKKMPGVSWPYGIWKVGSRKIMVTEDTVIRGDKSKAVFGVKVTIKGGHLDRFFTADEIQIRTADDSTLYADNL